MKGMKKILALVIALMVVLSMSAAFAANELSGTGDDVKVPGQTEIKIPKTLVVEGSLDKVYIPTVTYSYSIAPQAPETGAKVTDDPAQHTPAGSVESVVTIGPEGGATLASANVTFTTGEKTVGTLTEYLTVNVDITKFSKPGIYRYKITDTTDEATLFAAGVTRGTDYAVDRYLDVYIHYSSAATPVLEPYGFVLLKENKASVTMDDTAKSEGYIDSEEGETTTDKYTTVDVTVTKVVTGSMGDLKHEFDFAVALANNGLNYYAKENVAPTAITDDTKADTALNIELKNSDVYYIYGLSPKATVSYTETNDTADTYKVTITDNDSAKVNSVDAVTTAPNGTQTTTAQRVSNYPATDPSAFVTTRVEASAAQAITFTNNLDEISPTGVVLRFAPYIAMLVAGVALFIILGSKRRKNNDD